MDLEEIRLIVELMKENDLALFNMERDGFKLKLRRGPDQEVVTQQYIPAPQAAPAPAAAAAVPAAEAAPSGNIIRSPMVGTFYRSPGPGEKSFINVGDRVEANTTVCIIEAMKVMNEIKAETTGIVSRVLAEDSKPVQFDAPLFEVTPG